MSNTMIYRCPGPIKIHGVECEMKVVDSSQLESMDSEGWKDSPVAAQSAYLERLEAKAEPERKAPESDQSEPVEELEEGDLAKEIYEMACSGIGWGEITEKRGQKAPWLMAGKYAKDNALPTPWKDGE